MHIAIFTDSFLPQINGVVSYVFDTANQLQKRGHQVIIFAPRPRRGIKLNLEQYPFTIKLLPSLPSFLYPDIRFTIPSLPKVLLILKRFKPDVIHVQDPSTVGTEGLTAGKILKVPVAITFHTFFLDEEMFKNLKRGYKLKVFARPLWKLTSYYHNLANAVICPSRVAADELKKHGLHKDTIFINNGIDLSQIKKPSDSKIRSLRIKYHIPSDNQVVINVSRLAPDKSLDVLIKAWRLIKDEVPKTTLVLVGDGPSKGRLQALVEELNLKGSVIFTGKLSREEIIKNQIYYLGELYVTTSKIENQSISMLEAMAHGLPVVGVDARGTPELVDDRNGFLTSPDDPQEFAQAVLKALKNDKLREKMSKGSLEKIKDYDINASTDKLLAVFRVLKNFKTI